MKVAYKFFLFIASAVIAALANSDPVDLTPDGLKTAQETMVKVSGRISNISEWSCFPKEVYFSGEGKEVYNQYHLSTDVLSENLVLYSQKERAIGEVITTTGRLKFLPGEEEGGKGLLQLIEYTP